jgi:hypothetical protein
MGMMQNMAKKSCSSHENRFQMVLRFFVRLRTYSVSFVISLDETSRARWPSAVTDVHHRGTERTEDSRRLLLFHYSLDITARNRKNGFPGP